MSIFDVLSLLCGLALFLYGMEVMGDALKKSAGSGLKATLGKMTSSPVKGFLLGLGVTAIIQSSSATTVMVVGFVNSGTMTLIQAVGVIMGANVGTAVTAWITGLSGVGGDAAGVVSAIAWLKPSSWMPILALIGIALIMFVKRGKKKDIGVILLGFAVLMVGMDMMSDAVGGLKNSPEFQSILTMFKNPLLGVIAGIVIQEVFWTMVGREIDNGINELYEELETYDTAYKPNPNPNEYYIDGDFVTTDKGYVSGVLHIDNFIVEY